ncbi:MAG TPA: ABC transporter permease [Acidimicrobiia bacterium]
MTTHTLRDSATMLRRNVRRMIRYPVGVAVVVGVPIVLLLLFVYVLGETLGAGLGGASAGRADYVNYVFPGILIIAIAGAPQATAISVAMDMKEGIIRRFKTMAISPASVLNGHVIGNTIQTMVGLVIVVGIGILVGFRSSATLVEWLAAAGLLLLLTVALTWLAVAMGLVAKSVEGASNLPMFLILLPFLGSGFVPTEAMPTGLDWFAEYQPFTPILDTLRGLLLGTPVGNDWIFAVAWCIGIWLVGYLWAQRLYDREPAVV